ncbi:MAG: rubredoxin-like domain-containing protein [Planctomycetota bacterium]
MEKRIKWKCSQCKYVVEAINPPEACPSCQAKCSFTNVTCYTPECGGEDNIDPQLFEKDKENLS